MGTPSDHVPTALSEDSIRDLLVDIGFPRPISITLPQVRAAYHGIYRIKLPQNDRSPHTDLVLRVSGPHLPVIKTQNEVGAMLWVSRNTTIPVPTVVAYNSTTANPLGYEYNLLSHCPGVTLSDVYGSLGDGQIDHIIDQLVGFLAQLHALDWEQIGGLKVTETGTIEVAQVLDETFWQTADTEKYWPRGTTVADLNIGGPYSTYIELISAQIRKYMDLIQMHDSLSFMRELIPRLQAFVDVLPKHSVELNNVKLRLAHKDLHFANILYDETSRTITAILDWEFSGVVPMTQWNPVKAFLWNYRDGDEARKERDRLFGIFARRCEEEGLSIISDAAYKSPLQESMQRAADFLRAITELVPKGQRAERVLEWRAQLLEHLDRFGV